MDANTLCVPVLAAISRRVRPRALHRSHARRGTPRGRMATGRWSRGVVQSSGGLCWPNRVPQTSLADPCRGTPVVPHWGCRGASRPGKCRWLAVSQAQILEELSVWCGGRWRPARCFCAGISGPPLAAVLPMAADAATHKPLRECMCRLVCNCARAAAAISVAGLHYFGIEYRSER